MHFRDTTSKVAVSLWTRAAAGSSKFELYAVVGSSIFSLKRLLPCEVVQ